MPDVMPKRMQVLKIQDELKREGVESDLVDLDAEIDSKLSYPENYSNIMKKYKDVSKASQKTKQNKFGVGNVDFKYASQANAARSPQAQITDNAIRAKGTYTEKQMSRKPELLDKWHNEPGKSDIIGIDAFGSSKTRIIKRKVRQRKTRRTKRR